MKRLWILPLGILLGLAMTASPARPQGHSCQVGGQNETSELFSSVTSWAPVNFNPGIVPAGVTGRHLLISEVAPRGAGGGSVSDSSEYVEIYNPTAAAVSLEQVYLADDNLYYRIVNGPYSVTGDIVFPLPSMRSRTLPW